MSELVTPLRSFRLCVEDLLTARGWTPVERIISRRVSVFWEHPDIPGTLGLVAAVDAQTRLEERGLPAVRNRNERSK